MCTAPFCLQDVRSGYYVRLFASLWNCLCVTNLPILAISKAFFKLGGWNLPFDAKMSSPTQWTPETEPNYRELTWWKGGVQLYTDHTCSTCVRSWLKGSYLIQVAPLQVGVCTCRELQCCFMERNFHNYWRCEGPFVPDCVNSAFCVRFLWRIYVCRVVKVHVINIGERERGGEAGRPEHHPLPPSPPTPSWFFPNLVCVEKWELIR